MLLILFIFPIFLEPFIETQKKGMHKWKSKKERIVLMENSRQRTSYNQVWEF